MPTDCPQRDERLGWTGDAQAFSPHRRLQHGRGRLLHQVAEGRGRRPVRERQRASRRARTCCRSSRATTPAGAAGWADAAVIIPWNMYLSYGDKRILETQYDSMVTLGRVPEDARRRRLHLGRRLPLRRLAGLPSAGGASDYPGATTGKDLIATAFFAHSTDLLRRTAQVLGKKDDAARYGEQLAKIKSAFRREFVTETRPRRRGHADGLRARPAVRSACPRTCARPAAQRLAQEVRSAEASDDRLPRHAVPLPRAQPLRLSGRGLPAAQPRGVPVVALPGEAGRDHDLGAVGRPEAGRLVPGQSG